MESMDVEIPDGDDTAAAGAVFSPSVPRLIKAGTTVLTSEPWVWTMMTPLRDVTCAQCFILKKDLPEGQKVRLCSGCRSFAFCSKECQTKFWTEGHKAHCAMLGRLMTQWDNRPDESYSSMVDSQYRRQFLAAVQLALMVWNKRKLKILETHPGVEGKSPEEVFAAMKGPEHNRMQYRLWFKKYVPKLASVALTLSSTEVADFLEEISEIVFKMMYLCYTLDHEIGLGMYLEIPFMRHRCDINVGPIWLHKGKTMMMKALEDIPNYTGLSDLRYTQWLYFMRPFTNHFRSNETWKQFGEACECTLCTDEYNAELRPMKCQTENCTASIPTDERAFLPCSSCGVSSTAEQLQGAEKEYEALAERYEEAYMLRQTDGFAASFPCTSPDMNRKRAMLKTMHESKYIHPVNIYRLCCCFETADTHFFSDEYIKAWKYLKPMTLELIPAFKLPFNRCVVAFNKYDWAAQCALEVAQTLWKKAKYAEANRVRDEGKAILEQGIKLYISTYGEEDEGGILKEFKKLEEEFICLDTMLSVTDQESFNRYMASNSPTGSPAQ